MKRNGNASNVSVEEAHGGEQTYEEYEGEYEADDSYDEDSEDEGYWKGQKKNNRSDVRVANKNVSNKQKTTLQPQNKQFGKFVNKIKLDKYEGMLSNFAF